MSEEKLPEMIERVALAIEGPVVGDMGIARIAARAAIEAMREPTQEMIDACDMNIPTEGEIIGIWSDMIEAALRE